MVPQITDHFLIYGGGDAVRSAFTTHLEDLWKKGEGKDLMAADPELAAARAQKAEHLAYLEGSLAELRKLQTALK